MQYWHLGSASLHRITQLPKFGHDLFTSCFNLLLYQKKIFVKYHLIDMVIETSMSLWSEQIQLHATFTKAKLFQNSMERRNKLVYTNQLQCSSFLCEMNWDFKLIWCIFEWKLLLKKSLLIMWKPIKFSVLFSNCGYLTNT